MLSETPKYDEDKNICLRDWGHDELFHSGWFEDELIAHIMDVKLTHEEYEEGYKINLDKTTDGTDSSHTREDTVAMITITPRDRDYALVTRRSKVTLQGVPPNLPPVVGTYNIVEQLKKTPT